MIILLLFLSLSTFASAQTQVDRVMESIRKNNKTIQAERQFWQTQNLAAKTGNTPADPSVTFENLWGTPEGAGVQKDFSISQQFDFPSSYAYRNRVSNTRIEQNSFLQRASEQDVLLEANKLCLEIIYQNKKRLELERRASISGSLHNAVKRKLDLGDATILDYNRIKVQHISIQNDLLLQKGKLEELKSRLTELNGGQEISLADTIYPAVSPVPEFEVLDSIIEASSPVVKLFEKEIEVQQSRLNLQKALVLPKFETGYRSQSILGQSYRGFRIGISIPLWENKNRVKAQNQALTHSASRLEEHRVEHRYKNKELYERYTSLKQALQESQDLLSNLTTVQMLNKALELGQISSINYSIELSQYYSLRDRILELEKEYNVVIAELYKSRL